MRKTQSKKTECEAIKLPFSPVLASSIDELRDRVAMNKASMALVDGQIGLGKTTLAVEMAEYYQGSKLDLENQLAMGAEQFTRKLLYCVTHGLRVIIYDESGDFDKRSSMSSINKMLNRIFDTFRTYKILIIGVLPNVNVLDSQLFLKAIPRFLVHIESRDENKGTFTMYSLTQMMYLKDYMNKLVVPFEAYKRVWTSYRGIFHNLDEKTAAELDRISTAAKLQILQEFAQESSRRLEEDQQEKSDYQETKLIRQKISESTKNFREQFEKESKLESIRRETMKAQLDLERQTMLRRRGFIS